MASHTHTEEERRASEAQKIMNDLVTAQKIMGRLVTGVGFLALTWSTVVLLGGFVGALQMKEFWFLTAVSLVLASTFLDMDDYNLDFARAVSRSFSHLIGFVDGGFCGLFCLPLFLIPCVLVAFLINAALIINSYGPVASVAISMARLIQHDYDGSDAASRGKLRVALFVFYCLALAHGVCFFCWLLLRRFRNSGVVSKQCGFGESGGKVIREYFEETNLKSAKGLRVPAGWNLVAYAVGLLGSESPDDNLSGLLMLDTCVVETKTTCIRLELLSSRRAMLNLITMLGWTSMKIPDVQEMRERAARIMADISGELRIARFPGALQCVSSLLEAQQLPQITAARDHNHQVLARPSPSSHAGCGSILPKAIMRGKKKEKRAFEPEGPKELIRQGLLILERLADDEHNCREIVNTPGLLSKITAPVTSQAFLDAAYDDTWINILSSSLRVVSRLITAPGEAGTRLCHKISASKEAINNMLEILQGNTNVCKQLQEHAIEILTDSYNTKDFIETLERIFLDKSGASRLKRKTGEALAKLLSTKSASRLDHQLPKQDVKNLLTEIIRIILSTKIERKADEAACSGSVNIAEAENDEESQPPKGADQNEQNDEQSEERKLVAALLSLTVVICDKLIDANDFCSVVTMERELIEKLKDIIDRNNDTTADCLRIVKLTCQVVIAMMKLKPSCIEKFNKHNFKKVLSDASNTLSDLDTCMLFFGNDRELKKPARSLASLVNEAHQLFNNA